MRNPTSPAVVSLRKEQAADRKKTAKDELEDAIEDTFPASDPLSITQTAVSSGRANVEAAAKQVDEVAETVKSASLDRDYTATREDLRALSRDIAKLSETVRSIGTTSARAAKAEVQDQVQILEDKVRAQPHFWMTVAAIAGFVWGSARGR